MNVTKVDQLAAKGAYSLAVQDGSTIYISGQLPVDRSTGELALGTIEEETLCILSNIEAILQEYGCDRNQIVKTTVFITDPEYWGGVNAVYARFFTDSKPARSCVAVKEIPYMGFKVEIEAIATTNKR